MNLSNLRPWCEACEALVLGAEATTCPQCGATLVLRAMSSFEQDQRQSTRGRLGTHGWMALVSKASVKRRQH